MYKDKNELSLELARALHDTEVTTRDMEPTRVISTYDQIEAEFLPKLASDPILVVETKRRFAENKFLSLSKRDLPFDFILPLFESIQKLGYTNLEKEINMEIIFARYCIRQDQRSKATAILENVCSKLEDPMPTEEIEVYRQAKKTAKKLLEKMAE